MNKKLLQLYGLKFNPFSPGVPTEALRRTPAVESFLWKLEHALAQEGGFALITGEPGCGKSVTLRLVAERLSSHPELVVGSLSRPQANLADFYRELGDAFQVPLRPHNRWAGASPSIIMTTLKTGAYGSNASAEVVAVVGKPGADVPEPRTPSALCFVGACMGRDVLRGWPLLSLLRAARDAAGLASSTAFGSTRSYGRVCARCARAGAFFHIAAAQRFPGSSDASVGGGDPTGARGASFYGGV